MKFLLRVLNFLDVILRLAKGRHTLELANHPFAGVVGGKRFLLIAVETFGQILQVLRSRFHVLSRIEKVVRAHPLASPGNELHQALRTNLRNRIGLEMGLGLHDGSDEPGEPLAPALPARARVDVERILAGAARRILAEQLGGER